MSIFTMILDLACSNAYAVACALSTGYKTSVSFGEFKRRVAEQLTLPLILKKKKDTAMEPNTSTSHDNIRFHILSDNKKRKSTTAERYYRKDGKCYLCMVLGLEKTKCETMSSNMGCFECAQCFHLKCFNLMHHRHLNTVEFNDEMDSAINGWKRKRQKMTTVADPATNGGGYNSDAAS